MKSKLLKKFPMLPLIAGEFVFGIALSMIFFNVILSNDGLLGDSYATGLLRLFGGLSLVFFIAVLVVGIYGAIIKRQQRGIPGAIGGAIIYWFLSIFLYSLASFLPFVVDLGIVPFYIVLIGIIFGFNKGLKQKPNHENDVH